MIKYKLTVKINEAKFIHFTINEYSNNGGRIRFRDERTGRLKNFPEEWVAIEEVVE
jgi:hypothetical protein